MDHGDDVPLNVVRTGVLFRMRPPADKAATASPSPNAWSSPYPTLLPRHVLETEASTPDANHHQRSSAATTPVTVKTNAPSSREDFLALYQKSPMPRILLARQQQHQTAHTPPPSSLPTSASEAANTTPSAQTPRRRYIFRANVATTAASPRVPSTPQTTQPASGRDQPFSTLMPQSSSATPLPETPRAVEAPPLKAPLSSTSHRPPTPLRHQLVPPPSKSQPQTTPSSSVRSLAGRTNSSAGASLSARLSPFHRLSSTPTPPAKVRLSFDDPPPPPSAAIARNDAKPVEVMPAKDSIEMDPPVDSKTTDVVAPTNDTSAKTPMAPSSMLARTPLRNTKPATAGLRSQLASPQGPPRPNKTLSTPLKTPLNQPTPATQQLQDLTKLSSDKPESTLLTPRRLSSASVSKEAATSTKTTLSSPVVTKEEPDRHQRGSNRMATTKESVVVPPAPQISRDEPQTTQVVRAAPIESDIAVLDLTNSPPPATSKRVHTASRSTLPSSKKKRGPAHDAELKGSAAKKVRRVTPTDAVLKNVVGDANSAPADTPRNKAMPGTSRKNTATPSTFKPSKSHGKVAAVPVKTSAAKRPTTTKTGAKTASREPAVDTSASDEEGSDEDDAKMTAKPSKKPIQPIKPAARPSGGSDSDGAKSKRKRSRVTASPAGAAGTSKPSKASLAKFLSFDESDEDAPDHPLVASASKPDRVVLALRKWTVEWPPPSDGPSLKLVVRGQVSADKWESHVVQLIRRPRLFVSESGQDVSLVGAMMAPRTSKLPPKVANHFDQGIPSDWVHLFHSVLGKTATPRGGKAAAKTTPTAPAGAFSLFGMFRPDSDDDVAPRGESKEMIVQREIEWEDSRKSDSDGERPRSAAAKPANNTKFAPKQPKQSTKSVKSKVAQPADISDSEGEAWSPDRTRRKVKPSKKRDRVAAAARQDDDSPALTTTTRSGRQSSPVTEWWKTDQAVKSASGFLDGQDDDHWTKSQIAELKAAVRVVDPKHHKYWDKVAELVEAKSSAACRAKQFESVGSTKREKAKGPAKPAPLTKLSKAGTQRFKKQVRQFVVDYEAGHAGDDVCDVAPRPMATTSRLATPKSIRKFKPPPDNPYDYDQSSSDSSTPDTVLLHAVPPTHRDKLDAYNSRLLSQKHSAPARTKDRQRTSTWADKNEMMDESDDKTVRQTTHARGSRRLEGVLTPRGSMKVRLVKRTSDDDSSFSDDGSSDYDSHDDE